MPKDHLLDQSADKFLPVVFEKEMHQCRKVLKAAFSVTMLLTWHPNSSSVFLMEDTSISSKYSAVCALPDVSIVLDR